MQQKISYAIHWYLHRNQEQVLLGFATSRILLPNSQLMEILHQYYYHKGKTIAKALLNTILSFLFVGFAVYCFVHWDLTFMFEDWKGYLMLGIYGLITLGVILSAVQSFQKVAKARRGIPAFAVGASFLVIYDSHGLSTTIPFDHCERVRFKTNYRYRGLPSTLTLIVQYHTQDQLQDSLRFEVDLSELDRPQNEIDHQLNNIYKKYKKQQPQ